MKYFTTFMQNKTLCPVLKKDKDWFIKKESKWKYFSFCYIIIRWTGGWYTYIKKKYFQIYVQLLKSIYKLTITNMVRRVSYEDEKAFNPQVGIFS